MLPHNFEPDVKVFTFGIDRQYANDVNELKLVETKREKVLWSKKVRVEEFVYPTEPPTWGRGDENDSDDDFDDGDSRVKLAVIAGVVCFVLLIVIVCGGYYGRTRHRRRRRRQ